MACLIGLDLGTTTVSGVLFDPEHSRVRAQASKGNDSPLTVACSTRSEQDPQRLWALACGVLATLADQGQPVMGLALTGQKHGLLCVDSASQPLTPLVSWQDRRTAELLPDGKNTLDHIKERLAGLDCRVNGCNVAHGYGAATWYWLQEQGALPPATERVCSIAGWLVSQLTGSLPVSDPTLAASWGIYDLPAARWNMDSVQALGLNGQLLPEIHPSGKRIGSLLPSVARAVGLLPGLPVYNAMGDTQASFVGASMDSAIDREMSVFINLGTGGQICWPVMQFEMPDEHVEIRPLPDGTFLRVGASLCGGAAYAWLNRTVRAWLADFGLDVGEEQVYRTLETRALQAEDADGLRVRTTFLGVRGDPQVQDGAIEGVTLNNFRLGPLARATLRGMVDELYALYESHEGPDRGYRQVVATGGGVRKNPLLVDQIAARFGLLAHVPPYPETAALGALAISAPELEFSW